MLLASVYSPHLHATGGQRKKILCLVLAGDNHRRPLRCSDHMISKDKPDLDGEIRERALQLADAG